MSIVWKGQVLFFSPLGKKKVVTILHGALSFFIYQNFLEKFIFPLIFSQTLFNSIILIQTLL